MMIYLSKWREINSEFADYVDSQWYSHIKYWSLHYRTTAYQGTNTNNYTEAWHKVLKTKYTTASERRRVDELTQVFYDNVEPQY